MPYDALPTKVCSLKITRTVSSTISIRPSPWRFRTLWELISSWLSMIVSKNPATHAEAEAAMERTHKWLERCKLAHARTDRQSLFGIVQGSIYEDLREASSK